MRIDAGLLAVIFLAHKIRAVPPLTGYLPSVLSFCQPYFCSKSGIMSSFLWREQEILDFETTPFKKGKIVETKKTWWKKTIGSSHPGLSGGNGNQIRELLSGRAASGSARQIKELLAKLEKKALPSSSSTGSSTCDGCAIEWTCESPKTVEYGGTNYTVFHMPGSYQIIFQGKCDGTDRTCGSSGSCLEETSYYTWVLVLDYNLRVYPPLKFVPIEYSSYCYCANPGTSS